MSEAVEVLLPGLLVPYRLVGEDLGAGRVDRQVFGTGALLHDVDRSEVVGTRWASDGLSRPSGAAVEAAVRRAYARGLTYVPTWAGVAYVCIITDVFSRMIVGWRVALHMRTEIVLDAIEMACWSRGTTITGLRCHSDAGSQFTSLRYGERLADIGATPSIGTVADSYDNALAETVNGYDKAELIRGPARTGPWRNVEDVELATLGWVHWHNTQRLHGYLGDVPPTEFETTFYAAQGIDQHLVEIP